jgi:hypothetical protein
MKMAAVFWVVAASSLVEVYRRFRGACCLHYQGDEEALIALMMEAASTCETTINFHQTAWRSNPEDSHVHTRRRENLKSHQEIPFCFGTEGSLSCSHEPAMQ